MKVLFTGASSFTGYWFVREMASRDHDITATYRRSYSGLRKKRVENLPKAKFLNCRFGTSPFLSLLSKESFDTLCLHGALVENYKDLRFDVPLALASNTYRIHDVLELFKKNGGKKIVLTGSYYEKGEGAGTEPLAPFSSYALSKTFTSDYFEFAAAKWDLPLAKFVIPNPFGPYEEERFTSWLVKNWTLGKCPEIKTPDYVRDNIHVSLLAKAYAFFVEEKPAKSFTRFNPSGYISTQGEFTKLFASRLEERLHLSCPFKLLKQTAFAEPKERYNTDPLDPFKLGWSEKEAWDELAAYYKKMYDYRGLYCYS